MATLVCDSILPLPSVTSLLPSQIHGLDGPLRKCRGSICQAPMVFLLEHWQRMNGLEHWQRMDGSLECRLLPTFLHPCLSETHFLLLRTFFVPSLPALWRMGPPEWHSSCGKTSRKRPYFDCGLSITPFPYLHPYSRHWYSTTDLTAPQ